MADQRIAEEHFIRGMEAIGREDIDAAAESFRRAVTEESSYVDALFNLGKACKELGRLDEAFAAFRGIVARAPDDAEAWYMLGNTCYAMECYGEAEHCYRTILTLHQRDARAAMNLGVALHAAGQVHKALEVYARALGEHPDDPDLHYNRALSLLMSGEFADGWKELEWRFATSDHANPPADIPGPRWTGEPMHDSTILLMAEQGFGDTLQFARFIPEVRRRCGRVFVECQKEILPLLRSCRAIDVLVERGQASRMAFDAWAPLMSLPFLLGCTVPDCGTSFPYFSVDHPRMERWLRRFEASSRVRPRVGLVWGGNPRHKNDSHRSCPPAFLTPLIRQEDVAWFSLQKAAGAALPHEWEHHVADLGPDLVDFAETAAAIECLDLVVTVDTAVAHLAGALGKPVWLILPYAPDWRWMLAKADSAWYPSMRIFRQPRPGDWHAVIAAVSVELHRNLVQHVPGNLSAWNNLGITLQDGGNLGEAIDAFTSALKVDPHSAVVMNNLGYALLENGEYGRAEEWLRRGVDADPVIPDLHNNLGNLLRDLGEHAEAVKAYRKAIALRPEFAQAHWNLAQVLLQCGDFAEGWNEYEWRWRRADFTSPHRNFVQPVWNGEHLAGRTLLVHAEQGFGDALQFVRYVSMIVESRATVMLECHPELLRLFSGIPGIAGVFAHGSPLPAFDLHIPMMSLPRMFHTTLANVPARVPYLSVGEELARRWRARVVTQASMVRVGIAWSGTRQLPQLLNRACPLESVFPLLATRGAIFYSLQKTTSPSESLELLAAQGIRDLSEQLHDFADTAAAIRTLDMVISVDTAVAHLAGALGVPVWVLLPGRADWRWLLGRSDSPWYPTMRLFRQKTDGVWGSVIAEVHEALCRHIDSTKGSI